MSRAGADERIALLQARAHRERLAAQLALLDVREQTAPLRSAAGTVLSLTRLFGAESTLGSALRSLARLGLGRPQLLLPAATLAWSVLRRRPYTLLLAVAAGAAAWWLLRREPAARRDPPPQ